MIHLDTHVVVWLYTGEIERLSDAAVEALEAEELIVSPMVQLELTFLHEIGRLSVTGAHHRRPRQPHRTPSVGRTDGDRGPGGSTTTWLATPSTE